MTKSTKFGLLATCPPFAIALGDVILEAVYRHQTQRMLDGSLSLLILAGAFVSGIPILLKAISIDRKNLVGWWLAYVVGAFLAIAIASFGGVMAMLGLGLMGE